MALKIVSADERLARRPKVNIALFGPSGVGKTFQARTLDPETTLFIDAESGMLAVQDWRGDCIEILEEARKIAAHPWEYARALACLLRGPDPAADNQPGATDPYNNAAFESYKAALGDPAMFDKYETIFVDSITVAGRMSFSWSQRQPEAYSEKTGKPDTRGAYGLHGREMVRWLTMLQHIPGKSIIVVGILDEIIDDFNRAVFQPQIDGAKTALALPGIFDQVVTLATFAVNDQGQASVDLKKGTQRGFVCHQNNGFGVPAKDRSGRLALIEPPDLGALMKKIAGGPRADAMVTTAPSPEGQPESQAMPAAASDAA
jgi:hypothetical protein